MPPPRMATSRGGPERTKPPTGDQRDATQTRGAQPGFGGSVVINRCASRAHDRHFVQVISIIATYFLPPSIDISDVIFIDFAATSSVVRPLIA